MQLDALAGASVLFARADPIGSDAGGIGWVTLQTAGIGAGDEVGRKISTAEEAGWAGVVRFATDPSAVACSIPFATRNAAKAVGLIAIGAAVDAGPAILTLGVFELVVLAKVNGFTFGVRRITRARAHSATVFVQRARRQAFTFHTTDCGRVVDAIGARRALLGIVAAGSRARRCIFGVRLRWDPAVAALGAVIGRQPFALAIGAVRIGFAGG
jgi:hypothetical protein